MRQRGEPARSTSLLCCVWPLALALGATVPANPREAVSDAARGERAAEVEAEAPDTCPLCTRAFPATLPAQELLDHVGALAAANAAEIARLDARWRDGEFGRPGTREANRTVHRLARSTLKNWYAYLLTLVETADVQVLEPAGMAEVSARFCESTVFPIPRLRHIRLGQGRVCARYDLGGTEDKGYTLLGGKTLRYHVGEARVNGHPRRVLAVEWRSASVGRVEVLFGEHYSFRLEKRRFVDEEGSCDLFLALEVSGAWVHRFGVHRPAAFAFWACHPAAGASGGDAAVFRVGSALHVPGLRLRLPLLPDIGLGDLRLLEPPVPLLPVEDVRRRALPEWLPTDGQVDLAGWSRIGDAPEAVRELFPDR